MNRKEFDDIMNEPLKSQDESQTLFESISKVYTYLNNKQTLKLDKEWKPYLMANIQELIDNQIDKDTLIELKQSGWIVDGDNLIYRFKPTLKGKINH